MMERQNEFDETVQAIACYAAAGPPASELAYDTARRCLADSLGCALQATRFPACMNMVGPVVPGATMRDGVRVPGTALELDPVQAAHCIGTLIRWLDYNDTWLAAEWGHPSDNFGAILAAADYASQRRPDQPLLVRDVLTAAIRAYEIQGVLALENSFNRVGLDHVLLVRVASTAVATALLGGTEDQIANAVSQAWIDGGALRAYRHAPNTGSRKSWAAGDATSRGVKLALWSVSGEMGYPTALSAPRWGFQDVLFRNQAVTLARPLDCYVMENILFKVSFPAEFHAQTAVEAALQLHPLVHDRLDSIKSIQIETQEPAIRIIAKDGPLHNPADRDHCLQYMVAIPLIFGTITAEHYEADVANDPRIDALRGRMLVTENEAFSRDYLDPTKRSIGNALRITFEDGETTERVAVEYPIGHRRRREEAVPLLREKFSKSMTGALSASQCEANLRLFESPRELDELPVRELLKRFAT